MMTYSYLMGWSHYHQYGCTQHVPIPMNSYSEFPLWMDGHNNQIASVDHGTHALWICDLSSICFGQVNHQHHQMDLQKCSMSRLDPKLRSILSRLMIVLTPLSGWWFGTFGLFFHIL